MFYCVTPDASGAHRTRAQRAPQTRTVIGRTLSVRCSPDSCAERVARPPAHRTLSTELTLVRPVHSATPDSTPDAKGQRSVPLRIASGECFSVRNTPVTSQKFPTGAIENMHLIFSKAPNPAELEREKPTPLSTLETPSPLQMCEHHQVYTTMCMCVSIFTNIFPKGVSLSTFHATRS